MNLINFKIYKDSLQKLPIKKLLICTINAYSYTMVKKDNAFLEVLSKCDVLIPDGISIVWSIRFLRGERVRKIAGADLFEYEMNRLNESGGKVFFLGSSDKTLAKIRNRAKIDYPDVIVSTYSPPFKKQFSEVDNLAMIEAVNTFKPDVLFIGMTAPKQEKWAYQHFSKLEVGHICCIGAVFDFYAGTIKRAPKWMINVGIEWLYRLVKEPKRMWKRYLIGNTKFIFYVLKEKFYQFFKLQ